MISLMTALDPRKSMEYFALLGYEGDITQAFKITRPRRLDRKRGKSTRDVFHCFIMGKHGVGKVIFVFYPSF